MPIKHGYIKHRQVHTLCPNTASSLCVQTAGLRHLCVPNSVSDDDDADDDIIIIIIIIFIMIMKLALRAVSAPRLSVTPWEHLRDGGEPLSGGEV